MAAYDVLSRMQNLGRYGIDGVLSSMSNKAVMRAALLLFEIQALLHFSSIV